MRKPRYARRKIARAMLAMIVILFLYGGMAWALLNAQPVKRPVEPHAPMLVQGVVE